MKKPKHFTRIFVLLFAVFNIILGASVAAIYRSDMSARKTQSFAQNVSEFQQHGNDIDNIFNINVTLGRLITEHDDIKAYASNNADYRERDFSVITRIREKLMKHQSDFTGINLNLAVFKENDNLVISSKNTGTKEEIYENFGFTADYVSEYLSDITREGYYYKILPNAELNKTICIAHKRVYADQSSLFVITSFQEPDFSLVYNDEACRNLMLSNNLINADLSSLTESFAHLTVGDMEKGFLEKDNIDILYERSAKVTDLLYVYGYMQKSDPALVLMLIFMCMAGMVINAGISIVITRKIYKPIGKIVGLFSNTDAPQKVDEVEYVTDRVNSIMQKNRKLSEILEEKNKTLRDKFLFDVLNGFVFGSDILKGLKEYGLEYLEKDCLCVIFECEEYAADFYNSSRTKDDILSCIDTEMLKFTPGASVISNQNRITFIIKNKKNLNKFILNLINSLKVEYDVKVLAVLGETVQSIEHLRNSYSDLLLAIEYKFVLEERDIITLKEIQSVRKIEYYYPLESENMLINYILTGNKEQAVLLLNSILERNFHSAILDHNSIREFTFAVTSTIKRLLQKINKTESEVFQDDAIIYLELSMCKDRNSLEERIQKLFFTLIDAVETDKANRSDEVSDCILKYINDNLEKDISLNDISEEFGISVSNISKQLRSKYNIGFKSYLNNQRIGKAKQIMQENPVVKINDLAAMVGFNNSVSFIRAFKKSEGISPGEYQKTC